ncbi:MAG TPA: oligoendopeptidase, partial [bacterium]|nr:oligoendopeptidase [bacterium]
MAEHQAQALARAQDFARRFRGRLATLDGQSMASAQGELEGILATAQRPVLYAHLLFAADTGLPHHAALLAACQEQASRVQRELLFWRLEWLALPDAEA